MINLKNFCNNICKNRLNCTECILSGKQFKSFYDNYTKLRIYKESSYSLKNIDYVSISQKDKIKELYEIVNIPNFSMKDYISIVEDTKKSDHKESGLTVTAKNPSKFITIDSSYIKLIPISMIDNYYTINDLRYFCNNQCIFSDCEYCPLINFKNH